MSEEEYQAKLKACESRLEELKRLRKIAQLEARIEREASGRNSLFARAKRALEAAKESF